MIERRYETLDALRGVAALAVVLFHFQQLDLAPPLQPGAYLAVDFFFVLSGFVLALAYERSLQNEMSWRSFAIKRAIRLYPMGILGGGLGLLVLLLKWWTAPVKVDPLPQILVSGGLNSLMLPTFFGAAASRFRTFPGNPPLWSLFFEMVANLIWAWGGAKLKTASLIAFTITSGLILTALASSFHTANLGFDQITFLGGLARVSFGFPLGVVIFRLRHYLDVGRIGHAPLLLGLMLCALFGCPWAASNVGIPFWALGSILVLLPVIVILGAGHSGSSRFARFLGELSYPVYVIHFPLLAVASALHQTYLRGLNVNVIFVSTLGLVLGSAVLAGRFYDRPVRRFLSGLEADRFQRRVVILE